MKIANIEAKVIDHMGSDLSVVNAARVSFHKESLQFVAKDVQLIRYLAKHKHFSPFNHTFITARVKAPIFVARQLVKHRFMPWNEVSRRYVDEEPEFFIPEWRERAESVKQGSKPAVYSAPSISRYFEKDYLNTGVKLYNDLLASNVAPEQARMVLPQNMMTEWIWSGTLGAYADMLRLRLDEHTQYESRIVAQQLKEQIEPLFPVSLKALLETV